MLVVLPDGVARFAQWVQPTELPVEIANTGNADWRVQRSAGKVVDKCGIGCADSGNRANTAGDFFDVDAGIRKRAWHRASSSSLSWNHLFVLVSSCLAP